MTHARALDGLLAKADITDLIHAYCYHFDRANADAVAALFTEDAVVDYGPDVEDLHGSAVLRTMVSRGTSTLFAATSHHVSNVSITFDGPNRATSNCYVYAWHRYLESNEESELWGQYDHDFRRTLSGWRISRLVLSAAGTRNFHRARMHATPRG